MSFDQTLEYGQAGESSVARWLRKRGNTVLPVYEKVIDEGKGPQLFTPTEQLIAPDMFVFQGAKALWVEAKRKTAFTWHRNTQRWTTGIDLRHYLDYLKVDDSTPWPVWLFFLQENGTAKDSPPGCPTGLFANTLDFLRTHENHRSARHARGMVYWSHANLRLFATLEEIDL